MAEIIRLDRSRSGVHCGPLGLFFPTVYRVTGFSWYDDPSRQGEADRRYPHIFYTLNAEPTESIAEPTYTPITRLDPALDSGWVMIRHHANRSLADGYMDGLGDAGPKHGWVPVLYENNDGIFTIYHRPLPIEGCQNHLLVYMADHPDDDDCWTHAITSSGEITDDTVLFPPEELGE